MAGSSHRTESRQDDAPVRTLMYTIASDKNAGRDVHTQITEELARMNYDSHAAFAIKLALEEALANAIKHGNKSDPTKKVHIKATISPKQTEIVIEDEGPGFERKDVPDPTADENLDRCSGRGILLIETYMHEAKWSKNGRRLQMMRRNEPDQKAN